MDHDFNFGFAINGLYFVNNVHSILINLMTIYIMNACWILSDIVYVFIVTMWFYPYLINVVYHINWFVGIEVSLHLWNKFYLIMIFDPFYILLHLICWCLDECIYIILACICAVVITVFDSFSIRIMFASEWIWQCYIFFCFLEKFVKDM